MENMLYIQQQHKPKKKQKQKIGNKKWMEEKKYHCTNLFSLMHIGCTSDVIRVTIQYMDWI